MARDDVAVGERSTFSSGAVCSGGVKMPL